MKDFALSLLPVLQSLLTIAVTMAVPLSAALLHKFVKNAALEKTLDNVTQYALSAVMAVEQTYVSTLSKGPMTESQALTAKAAALQTLKNQIGPAKIADLLKHYGSADALDAALGTKIEASVLQMQSWLNPPSLPPPPLTPKV